MGCVSLHPSYKAVRVNGLDGLIITKLDVLDSVKEIKICTGYSLGDKIIKDFPTELDVLKNCKPLYETMDGWDSPTTEIRTFEDLPDNAQKFISRIEELAGVKSYLLSVGAGREASIRVVGPFG